jgi:hypothetical protein
LLERRKIELCFGPDETATQVQPWACVYGRSRHGRGCPRFAETDQIADRAVEYALLVFLAAFELLGLNGVELA